MWPIGYEYEKFEFFRKVYNFHDIKFFTDGPIEKIQILLYIMYKSKFEMWAMCGQFDSNAKDPKKKDNIIEFPNKEIHCKKIPQKALKFEIYNLWIP